jgi:predicted DNA-binding transcriptional regulator AlpA
MIHHGPATVLLKTLVGPKRYAFGGCHRLAPIADAGPPLPARFEPASPALRPRLAREPRLSLARSSLRSPTHLLASHVHLILNLSACERVSHTANEVDALPQTRHARHLETKRRVRRDSTSMKLDSPSPLSPLAARSYLKSSAVMEILGYRNRSAFWDFVRRDGVPHIRLNPRRIMFEEKALSDWLSRRSSNRR